MVASQRAVAVVARGRQLEEVPDRAAVAQAAASGAVVAVARRGSGLPRAGDDAQQGVEQAGVRRDRSSASADRTIVGYPSGSHGRQIST